DKQNADASTILELKLNVVSLHEAERVVFSCRLPADRRRSILGQREVHTSGGIHSDCARVCWRTPPCGVPLLGSCSPSPSPSLRCRASLWRSHRRKFHA